MTRCGEWINVAYPGQTEAERQAVEAHKQECLARYQRCQESLTWSTERARQWFLSLPDDERKACNRIIRSIKALRDGRVQLD
ncbi:hypothetical protein PU634_05025 [Oceanimonas pelagia]|uniref:Uncharacterized protein n=1 Tax=Oceanimonas pelagia TaxID=3028314 RepID=A0AA50KPQ2_9GAMM|nr:hypothetical protein [Oceanimonas pelagia]WMC11730.1 hypothetical protein PU634_05025 [Oceanimonas pelagia]